MNEVRLTAHAVADLDAIYEVDADSAAEIETALEEIQNDNDLSRYLHERFFRNLGPPSYEVDHFNELWEKGLNIFRMKFWDYQGSLVPYRVLYAHNPKTDCFYILAVLDRKITYDTQHPIVKRVLADYERLGIPTY